MQIDPHQPSSAVHPAEATDMAPPAGGWSAVYALTLCVGTLIASEFMPLSLLTPIASDLRITQGQAGQAIAVSGIFAVLTSLSISALTQRIDRRALLLWLTAIMLISGIIVALAPNFPTLLAGRALVGVVIGGFWSMTAAMVMRLLPMREVPRGLALMNGGNALATTIAAPLGSFLGQHVGWRGAFFCVVPLAAVTFIWLFVTLPRMPPRDRSSAAAAFRVLGRPNVPLGIAALGLLFMGQFALFTYLRPFLESVTRADVATLSMLLLALGLSGLLGNYLIGFALRTRLYALLVAMPIALAAISIGLIVFGASPPATAALLALWGMIATAAPVGWWTWLSKVLPEDAEAGGGLMVAAIQLSITFGAAAGGILFDRSGYRAAFLLSAAILLCSAAAALLAARRASTSDIAPISRKEHCHA